MEYQRSIEGLTKHYEREGKLLRTQIEEKRQAFKEQDNTLDSVPKILKALNNTCKDSNVIIDKLVPFKNNPFKFELNFITDYYKFIKILSEFEKLNIVIESLAIEEYETSLDNPKKAITLIVKVVGDVEQDGSEINGILDRIVAQNGGKNPFQTHELDRYGAVRKAINLTYLFKLSGISLNRDRPSATIDGKTYFIGDKFYDKGVIKGIERGKVKIVKRLKSGTTQEYFIGVRRRIKRTQRGGK
jgi:hypothetical protein